MRLLKAAALKLSFRMKTGNLPNVPQDVLPVAPLSAPQTDISLTITPSQLPALPAPSSGRAIEAMGGCIFVWYVVASFLTRQKPAWCVRGIVAGCVGITTGVALYWGYDYLPKGAWWTYVWICRCLFASMSLFV
jgi:hypothetical protein